MAIVKLDHATHTYTDETGRKYLSVSKLLEMVSEKFDVEKMAPLTAKKMGVSVAEVKDDWDKKRDGAATHGTRIHNSLEDYANNFSVKEEDNELLPVVKSINAEFKDYARAYNEVILHSEGYGVAGTTDKLLWTSTHPNSVVDLADYKTNVRNGIQYESKYKKYLLGPVDHLQDCNYNKYCLQLSIYAYMFQLATGRKIGKLYIIYIPPTDMLQWRKIPVPYMALEARAILDYYKSMRSVAIDTVFEEVKPVANEPVLTPAW